MIRWAFVRRVFAGAIFGLYMANLLYFLNPQIEITPGRLALVTLLYGAICGLLFGSLLWLLRLLRVRFFGRAEGGYRSHGFGFVVLASFASSAIYWIHLAVVRIYLPIGAVRILSKATIVISVTAFLLFILWLADRSADRRTSLVIFAAGVGLIALSSIFLYQRREGYRTDRRTPVVADIGTIAGRRPVTFVAVRNLPYDWIITMRGEGLLPFFEQKGADSFLTRLEPFATTSPKAVWASLATGKLPYRHGVTGRFSYRTLLNRHDPDERFLLLPSGVGFRAWGLIPPVRRISANLPSGDALPLWSLFERLSLPASVVNWPGAGERSAAAGDPAADDRRAIEVAMTRTDTAINAVALEGFAETVAKNGVSGNELPPRATRAGDAIRRHAQEIDALLARLVRQDPRRLVVICSPSAVVPPPLPATPYAFAMDAIGSGDPGADDGFLLIAGEGTSHRPNPAPALVPDVVPTILFIAGLPVGRDMDGRIVSEAFDDAFLRASPLSAIQTYEAQTIVVRRTAS